MKRLRFLIISILLIPVMLSGSMISLSAEESPVWDGKSAEEFAGGTGTAEDPYIIQTPQQLMFFSRSVSIGTSSYENEYVKLADNIVLNDTAGWENWDMSAPKNKWAPIGSEMFGFRGTFDGNGFTVSGVYCLSGNYRGLFGYVSSGATVKNVGVVNSFIRGISDVGGVVGYAVFCTVSNCYFTGSVTGDCAVGGVVGYLNGGTVNGCCNTGPVSGVSVDLNNFGIGGVVGYAVADPIKPAVIGNCYNTGAVTGTGSQNGGIAGTAIACKIDHCRNTGMVSGASIIGGLAGYSNKCVISNCYNVNSIHGLGEFAGGLAGWAVSCTIQDCYNTGAVKGDESVGGIAGDISSYGTVPSALSRCYNSGTVQGNKRTGGAAGWILGVKGWFYPASVNDSYYLKDAAFGGINGADVSGQAIALTAEEMKLKETYTDWDFITVWEFGGSDTGYAYPTLIGVQHQKTGTAAPAMENLVDEETSSGGNYLVFIIISCFVLVAGSAAAIIITKKEFL